MDYVQILPRLILGSHPQTTEDIERLRRESGITAVLNLQSDDDMRAVGVVWEPLEAHYRACGILLRRVPVRDFDPVDLRKKLPECVRNLDELLAAGHSVYLHCTAGSGRSPTVAIAYLHWCRGWDLDQAVAYIKERRECVPKLEVIRLANWAPRPSERSSASN
jgi:protein-tyrosine phosphatase